MIDEYQKYLTELSSRIAELASALHRNDSWVIYEDIISDIEHRLKIYRDCDALKDAYQSLVKEYRIILEHGVDNTENALLSISNNIIQAII